MKAAGGGGGGGDGGGILTVSGHCSSQEMEPINNLNHLQAAFAIKYSLSMGDV